jgi:hypothetical protein
MSPCPAVRGAAGCSINVSLAAVCNRSFLSTIGDFLGLWQNALSLTGIDGQIIPGAIIKTGLQLPEAE